MTRIIVHAGFHKTGTTSLQRYLAQNAPELAPYICYYGQNDFLNAGALARIYAQRPFRWRLWAFGWAFRRFLRRLPDAEVIVLSRETFAGNMPGHKDWRGQPIRDFKTAAIPLCQNIVAALRARFGNTAQIEFVFTTRDREDWLRSVYGHLVRSIHLTQSEDAFVAQFDGFTSLEDEATQIAAALRPVKVHIVPLETLAARPLGPATAVLDLLDLPQEVLDSLPKPTRHNTRQPRALEDAFLALNRSNLTKSQLRRRKEALLRQDQSHG